MPDTNPQPDLVPQRNIARESLIWAFFASIFLFAGLLFANSTNIRCAQNSNYLLFFIDRLLFC